MSKKIIHFIIPGIAFGILAFAGMGYWHYTRLFPSTDDAYVKAHVINITPRVNGTVTEVFVQENQHVNKGDVLFTIDRTPYQLAVDKAQAELEHIKNQLDAAQMNVKTSSAKVKQAEAELNNTRSESHRMMVLMDKGYISRSQGDA